jgi:purine-nucleoside phosphorylase
MPEVSTGEFTLELYDKAADTIREKISTVPSVGLILGSGLNGLAEEIENAVIIPYSDIPHFPISTVKGHAGRLVIGELAGVNVCVMQGRFHFYEGYSMQQTVFPVRVMARLGLRQLIITNAAGGVNPDFSVGDLMLIEDHLNFPGMAGNNPLRGPNLDDFGPRFPAANRTYTRALMDLAEEVAAENSIKLRRGVYAMIAGPNFETPAEIRMLRTLGADSVGMSTVPETLVAHHAGLDVLAISTITNMAIDDLKSVDQPTHEEVAEAGAIIVPRLSALLTALLQRLS